MMLAHCGSIDLIIINYMQQQVNIIKASRPEIPLMHTYTYSSYSSRALCICSFPLLGPPVVGA